MDENAKESKIDLFIEALENNLMMKMEPTGDCFYDCIVTAFDLEDKDIREFTDVIKEANDDKVTALRRTAAEFLTPEVFESYKLSHKAGLVDYSFMSKVDSLEKLQEVMVQSGRDVGLHDCLWANEFEISVVCKVLHICCLVWDTTAKSKTDMLLKVGEEEKDFIILKK